jgi:hypothetical protein
VLSVASIAQWIQSTNLATALRESELMYPIVMSSHLASIALFGGMILMTDLRILGLAMRSQPISDVVGQLRPWKWLGFIIMVTCGISLAAAKAVSYYDNPYFVIKMTLLALIGVHALIFRRSVYLNTASIDRAKVVPRVAKIAAGLSLALWLGVLCAGRWIAYYERPGETGTRTVASPALVSQSPSAR